MSLDKALKLFDEVDAFVTRLPQRTKSNTSNYAAVISTAIEKCKAGIALLPAIDLTADQALTEAWNRARKQISKLFNLKLKAHDQSLTYPLLEELNELLRWIKDNFFNQIMNDRQLKQDSVSMLVSGFRKLATGYTEIAIPNLEKALESSQQALMLYRTLKNKAAEGDRKIIADEIYGYIEQQIRFSINVDFNIRRGLIAEVLSPLQLDHLRQISKINAQSAHRQALTAHGLITYFQLHAPQDLRLSDAQKQQMQNLSEPQRKRAVEREPVRPETESTSSFIADPHDDDAQASARPPKRKKETATHTEQHLKELFAKEDAVGTAIRLAIHEYVRLMIKKGKKELIPGADTMQVRATYPVVNAAGETQHYLRRIIKVPPQGANEVQQLAFSKAVQERFEMLLCKRAQSILNMRIKNRTSYDSDAAWQKANTENIQENYQGVNTACVFLENDAEYTVAVIYSTAYSLIQKYLSRSEINAIIEASDASSAVAANAASATVPPLSEAPPLPAALSSNPVEEPLANNSAPSEPAAAKQPPKEAESHLLATDKDELAEFTLSLQALGMDTAEGIIDDEIRRQQSAFDELQQQRAALVRKRDQLKELVGRTELTRVENVQLEADVANLQAQAAFFEQLKQKHQDLSEKKAKLDEQKKAQPALVPPVEELEIAIPKLQEELARYAEKEQKWQRVKEQHDSLQTKVEKAKAATEAFTSTVKRRISATVQERGSKARLSITSPLAGSQSPAVAASQTTVGPVERSSIGSILAALGANTVATTPTSVGTATPSLDVSPIPPSQILPPADVTLLSPAAAAAAADVTLFSPAAAATASASFADSSQAASTVSPILTAAAVAKPTPIEPSFASTAVPPRIFLHPAPGRPVPPRKSTTSSGDTISLSQQPTGANLPAAPQSRSTG